jgi:hypothetical protein
MKLNIKLFPGHYSVAQLPSDTPAPRWAKGSHFLAYIQTEDEHSIVCKSEVVPVDAQNEPGWRLLKIDAQLDFSMVGVLANLSGCLAKNRISVFVISTFNTDYFLVKDEQLSLAVNALRKVGHTIR